MIILLLGAVTAGAYLALGLAGDLREHIAWFLASFAALTVLMLVAWRLVCRDPGSLSWAVGAALLFRIVAAMGEPALSDDVYRYVWDGRVQVHGVHPYRYAPSDPAVADLRDGSWEHINHPELKTIYPPAAQMVLLLLASIGAGPVGMKLFLGLVDFGVVLATGRLLRCAGLPRDRLRVVLVGLGIAEVDQQPVAQVLGDVPLEAADDLGAGLLVGPHRLAQALRTEPL